MKMMMGGRGGAGDDDVLLREILVAFWKTTVGRIGGPDGFVLGDAWRFLKGCLQDYAASLVSGSRPFGPLKCPCCHDCLEWRMQRSPWTDAASCVNPRNPHRIGGRYARAVIQRASLFAKPGDVDFMDDSAIKFLEKWEDKSRDEILRSMEDFRPCPHCSSGGGSGEMPFMREMRIIQQRGRFRHARLSGPNKRKGENCRTPAEDGGNPSSTGILVSYFVYYFYCTGRSTQFDRGEHYTEVLQVLSAVLPSVLLPILSRMQSRKVRAMSRPEFCWACMRSRTRCLAYQCTAALPSAMRSEMAPCSP
ncbi:hypothetical protein ACHAW5_004764 [Stephanodiscus triporus]|uniref:Thiol oxidase n=1 Tax=Stephanodiscus triporus TaxID=2934178 RepID=A0ABD3PXJ3_9STRA